MKPSKRLIQSIQCAANLAYKNKYTLYFGQNEKGLGLEPIFSKGDDQQIKCLQEKVIAVYTIRQCVRHLLMSYNYLSASYLLYDKRHKSASAIMSYNSCYHTAKSFMALKGDLSFQIKPSINIAFNPRESIRFHFKERQSQWHTDYKVLQEDHTKLWNRFSEYFKAHSPPEYFNPMFKYWFPRKFIGQKTEKDFASKSDFLVYTLTNNVWGHYRFQEKRKDFFHCLQQCRHDAIYRNQGFDLESYHYLIEENRGLKIGSEILSTPTTLIKEFSFEFFKDILKGIIFLLNNINVTKKTREFLLVSIYYPPFDEIEKDRNLEEQFEQIMKIENWFREARPKMIR
ncbi:hypothetical protein [Roseivirga thermotolerans]|uniref:Uncharacterized protein n=1 Tax=Roseivirga thermotolerans TaxID=1758176 RepID=A0ABQ3I2W8_9BACT|nr:hypothetical protein [Roseivirga thermotolerans]GHE59468.1 hypothetical protein GCM10011340_12700 [Roseivirga thermotolerans]